MRRAAARPQVTAKEPGAYWPLWRPVEAVDLRGRRHFSRTRTSSGAATRSQPSMASTHAVDAAASIPPPSAQHDSAASPVPARVPADKRSKPRSVRVAEFDRLTRRVEELSIREAGLRHSLAAVQADVRGSRQAMLGLDVLRAVARQQEFLLGRSLKKVLANRLLNRLKECPARAPSGSRSLTGRARQEKAAIVLDVLFPRKRLDELVSMLSATYTPRAASRRSARPLWTVIFSNAAAMLRALGLSVGMENMCREFRRADGSTPARPLLESIVNEDGRRVFVLCRKADERHVLIAARETEQYHVRRRAYVHDLKERSVPRDELEALASSCPSFLSWRETTVSASIDAWEGGDACGLVTLSIPCCTMEVLPPDVRALAARVA